MKATEGEAFGERLARLRKAHGYTQTEFAELLSTSQRMMTYWEREGGRPPGHLVARMAELLNVSVDALLGAAPLREPQAPRHSRLWHRLRQVEKLSEADRKAVLRFVEALLARQQLAHQRG